MVVGVGKTDSTPGIAAILSKISLYIRATRRFRHRAFGIEMRRVRICSGCVNPGWTCLSA
jgi:hypothetical protein